MQVLQLFAKEVKHRQAERDYKQLTTAQRDVLKNLKCLFDETVDVDTKAKINLLEEAFRGVIPRSVNQELNAFKCHGANG
jgi:hypothetical protein